MDLVAIQQPLSWPVAAVLIVGIPSACLTIFKLATRNSNGKNKNGNGKNKKEENCTITKADIIEIVNGAGRNLSRKEDAERLATLESQMKSNFGIMKDIKIDVSKIWDKIDEFGKDLIAVMSKFANNKE